MVVQDWKKIVKHLEGKIEEERMANSKLIEKNLALSKGKHYNTFSLLVLLVLFHHLIFLWVSDWFFINFYLLYISIFIFKSNLHLIELKEQNEGNIDNLTYY